MLIETFAKFGGYSLNVFEVIQPFSERASKARRPGFEKGQGYSSLYLEGSVQEYTFESGEKLKYQPRSYFNHPQAFRFGKIRIKKQKFLPPLRFNL